MKLRIPDSRQSLLHRLTKTHLDVLIIGGGIIA
jgi:glycerol-3-phosphate dehydrogenase